MEKSVHRFLATFILSLIFIAFQPLKAQPANKVCPRPAPGSIVGEPEDLHSENGIGARRLKMLSLRRKKHGAECSSHPGRTPFSRWKQAGMKEKAGRNAESRKGFASFAYGD
jgi:hypothetical protein